MTESIRKAIKSIKNRGWAIINRNELQDILKAFPTTELIVTVSDINAYVYIVEVKK